MNFLMVFIGGGLGASLRYLISTLIPYRPPHFPWATFLTNMLSCIIIGYLMGILLRNQLSGQAKLLLITGFCGGFSTFSTFATETLQMIKAGAPLTSGLYVLASIVIGSGLVFIASQITQ